MGGEENYETNVSGALCENSTVALVIASLQIVSGVSRTSQAPRVGC